VKSQLNKLPLFFVGFVFAVSGIAAETKKSYIEELKHSNPSLNDPLPTESFTEKKRGELKPRPSSSYIEEVKRARPQVFESPAEADSYSKKQLQGLEPEPKGGAIEAVHKGRSEIKFTKEGHAKSAAGIRVGVTAIRDIIAQADYGNGNFNEIYGTGFAPDINLFGEWHLINNDYVGSLGLQFGGGFTYHSGFGAFEAAIPRPTARGTAGSGNFSGKSRTKFNFVTVPVSLAGIYRFNVLHYVRPYIAAGPSVIGYYEGRSDGRKGNRGYSFGIDTQIGAGFLLDFLSRSDSFAAFSNSGIYHTYLTVEYHRQVPLASEVDFASGIVVAGFCFEI